MSSLSIMDCDFILSVVLLMSGESDFFWYSSVILVSSFISAASFYTSLGLLKYFLFIQDSPYEVFLGLGLLAEFLGSDRIEWIWLWAKAENCWDVEFLELSQEVSFFLLRLLTIVL